MGTGFEKVMSSSNKSVRSAGVSVYEELYKYMKDGVNPLVDKLPKNQ